MVLFGGIASCGLSMMRGEANSCRISKEYGPSKATVINWTRLYEMYGGAGLYPVRKNQKYPVRVKWQVVEEYLGGGVRAVLQEERTIRKSRSSIRRHIHEFVNGCRNMRHRESRGW